MTLRVGQTARLAYVTVTVQRFAHGKDGISAGYRVQVCSTSRHPSANADGTTRTSTDPWSFLLRDGESSQTRYTMVAVWEFERDNGWSPNFTERRLRVGQCTTGWIGVRHGNSDLIWGGITYAPRDFGDTITWTN